MNNIINEKKINYPKSNTGKQCIGPCYKPNTVIVHPITLEHISQPVPFCPVNEWTSISDNGTTQQFITDECLNPTNDKKIPAKEEQLNMILPYMDFNKEMFLKTYYEIYSFEDALIWLENHTHVSINNKIRIIDCSLGTYGLLIDFVDYRLVDFLIELIKKKWINHIYNKLYKYINIDNKKIYIINPKNNKLNNNDYIVERMNYIIDTFINNDEIIKFIEKYFKYRKDNWNNIVSHINNIEDELIIYIEQKIIKTLEK